MSRKRKGVLVRALVMVAVGAGLTMTGSGHRAVADVTGHCWRANYTGCCETGFGLTWKECWPGPYYCVGIWVHNDYFWQERSGSYGWDPPIEGYTGEIKCDFYEPACAYGQTPTGCTVLQTLRTLYCVGVVPQGDYDCWE